VSQDIGAFFINHSILLVACELLSDAHVERLRQLGDLFHSHCRRGIPNCISVCLQVAPSLLLRVEHLRVSVRSIDNSLHSVEI
jgi:hypothetical protein